MTMVCYETNKDVENPYKSMAAVLRGPDGKIAFSDLNLSLCNEAYSRVKKDLCDHVEEIGVFGYGIQTVTGTIGGLFRTVQWTMPSTPHKNYKFLDEAVACAKLPKTASELKKKLKWREQVNGRWQDAEWADAVYVNV